MPLFRGQNTDFPNGLTAEGPLVVSVPSSAGSDFLTLKDTLTGHQVGIQTNGLATDPDVTHKFQTTAGGQLVHDGASGTFDMLGTYHFKGGLTQFGDSVDNETLASFKTAVQGANVDFLTVTDTSSLSNGFTISLGLATSPTNNVRIAFPTSAVAATLVTTSSTDSLSNKTLSGPGAIKCGTNTSLQMKFLNASSLTQFMMLDTSAITGQRNMAWPDEAGQQSVTGNQAVGSGSNATARAPGKVDVTNQGADFTQAQIVTSPTAGFWRLDSYLECTTSAVGAGTMTTTWGWTDDVGATTDASQTLVLTATGRATLGSDTRIVYVASGHITVKCLITGSYSTAKYAFRARATFLG